MGAFLITVEQFDTLAREQLPFMQMMGLELVSIEDGVAIMRARCDERHLRPGGTVSGPLMMALSDAVMYAMIMAHIGPVIGAVTTNLNINFLRMPPAGNVLAEASLMKAGKRLMVGEVQLYSESDPHKTRIAHATATFSIPADKTGAR